MALSIHMLCYAKSLQLCPTLCDPIDGSLPGSPVFGILQARTLEWVAISFSISIHKKPGKMYNKGIPLLRLSPKSTHRGSNLDAQPSGISLVNHRRAFSWTMMTSFNVRESNGTDWCGKLTDRSYSVRTQCDSIVAEKKESGVK